MAAGLCRKMNRSVSGPGNGAIYPLRLPIGHQVSLLCSKQTSLQMQFWEKRFCSLLLAFGSICLPKGIQLASSYLALLEKQNVAGRNRRRRQKREKKKKRLSPAYTQFHLLLNFVRASAGDTDVGSGESLSPCP